MSGYYRCSHCRGFYEVELGECKYCHYTTVLNGVNGQPRVFPDRETCRAIQVAEYEQLGKKAKADIMRTPADELTELCTCLHCGPEGPAFEAVEMRWMPNERKWACPCTTCGGRGFSFDIHPVKPRWECFDCGKKWLPPNGNYKYSNCKCPVCGSTIASGMFEDEYSEEEIQAMSEEEYANYFGKTRAQEDEEMRRWDEEWQKRKQATEADSSNETDDHGDENEGESKADTDLTFGSDAWSIQHQEGPGQDDIDFPRLGREP